MSVVQQGSGKRLYRQVVDKILALIESGEYPAGSRLPAERELSERFGVSRPTIREAVIALEGKGRVFVKTGSGVYVLEKENNKEQDLSKNISPFELLEARVFVEGEAAALAASMITEEQLAALEAALEEMKLENENDNTESQVADRKFHTIIFEATNNRVLGSIINNLWDVQAGLHHIRKSHKEICMANPQVRLDEHRKIYEALAKRDPAEARRTMRMHFARGIDALHQTTEQEVVKEVEKKFSATRERFSLDRLKESI